LDFDLLYFSFKFGKTNSRELVKVCAINVIGDTVTSVPPCAAPEFYRRASIQRSGAKQGGERGSEGHTG
jgi:hypothetical protein